MFRESNTRSVAKAISWRIVGTIATSALVFVFTRRWALSLAIGGLEFFIKIGLFWLHERVWNRIRYGKRQIPPMVLWFTGLSGSGKTTLSNLVVSRLREDGLSVEHLDGDTIRHLFPSTGFTKLARDEHVKRVGYLASRLEQHGVFVVASLISPYRDAREFVRGLCRNFVEIHVSTPLEVCEARDTKGLYASARRGELECFTGIDDPYEAPIAPELVVDTSQMSPEQAGAQVLRHIRNRIRRGG